MVRFVVPPKPSDNPPNDHLMNVSDGERLTINDYTAKYMWHHVTKYLRPELQSVVRQKWLKWEWPHWKGANEYRIASSNMMKVMMKI